MKAQDLLVDYIDPAVALLGSVTKVHTGNEALVLLVAIAGQESGWSHRMQIVAPGVPPPARSYWQFERHGGVAELFQKTPVELKAVCDALDIPYNPDIVFEAMAWNDTLACCMARLLLWQDPKKLPDYGDVNGGWDYYNSNWRPGAPRPNDWPEYYKIAMELI